MHEAPGEVDSTVISVNDISGLRTQILANARVLLKDNNLEVITEREKDEDDDDHYFHRVAVVREYPDGWQEEYTSEYKTNLMQAFFSLFNQLSEEVAKRRILLNH